MLQQYIIFMPMFNTSDKKKKFYFEKKNPKQKKLKTKNQKFKSC